MRKAKKNWKEERDEKLRAYIEKRSAKIGLSAAYFRATERFGLSYPTVIKIYRTQTEKAECECEMQ